MPKKNLLNNIEVPVINSRPRFNYQKIALITLVALAVIGVVGSAFFYNKYKSLSANPNAKAEGQTAELVAVLGKLIELPPNEIPTIATISDKDKLKDQVFFKQAENGDLLFAYTGALKAILYRPSANKIINVAPISEDSEK